MQPEPQPCERQCAAVVQHLVCSQQERQPGTAAREQPAGSHDPLPDQRPAGRDQFCQLQQSVEMLQKQVNRMETALQEALKHLECRDKLNSGQGPTDSTDWAWQQGGWQASAGSSSR